MPFGMLKFSACLAFLLAPKARAYEDICTQFNNIYKDGTELCEVMWDGAFEVVDDEDRGYTKYGSLTRKTIPTMLQRACSWEKTQSLTSAA